jgi:hypothetical protein
MEYEFSLTHTLICCLKKGNMCIHGYTVLFYGPTVLLFIYSLCPVLIYILQKN